MFRRVIHKLPLVTWIRAKKLDIQKVTQNVHSLITPGNNCRTTSHLADSRVHLQFPERAAKHLSAASISRMASSPPPGVPASSSSVDVKKGPISQLLYRRPLPDTCVAFGSQEGKAVFREALASGHMNCYFKLAAQFRTQDEPAYCGLSTLIMVLNALEIDPGRVWKGPWKWYHEDMLDCCVSTELVRQEGITFDQFTCLAHCNNLQVDAARADTTFREHAFRDLVKSATSREDSFLVLSYSRQALKQTGDGHFAPVSGYHPGKDLVLILDTARFKYPPHWIPLPLLFQAMQRLDKATGLPRGYIQLWPTKDAKCLLLFKTSEQFSVNANQKDLQNFQAFLTSWTKELQEPCSSSEEAQPPPLSEVIHQALQGLLRVAEAVDSQVDVLRTQDHISCTHGCKLQCIVKQLLTELRSTAMFRAICEEILKMGEGQVHPLENVFGLRPGMDKCKQLVELEEKEEEDEGEAGVKVKPCCDMRGYLCLSDFLTAFFLSWPYALCPQPCTLESTLNRWAKVDLQDSSVLEDEMTILHRQLKRLMGFHASSARQSKCKSTCCKQPPGNSSSSNGKCQKPEGAGKSCC